MQGRDKETQEKKIEEMEQDEEIICTIRKDNNHISNQDLITKRKEQRWLQPMMRMASYSSQKKRKIRKFRKIRVKSKK